MIDRLLAAVQAEPDDDRTRMVYADALQQLGDPRGEFIAVQVQLAQARSAYDKKLATKLAKREGQLLAEHELAWVSPVRALLRRAIKFRRGFIEVAMLEDAHELVPVHAELRAAAPLLRAIEVHGPIGALGHWNLAHVDEVVAHRPVVDTDLRSIASASHSRLTSLACRGDGMGDAALVALVELPRPLRHLELGLDGRPTRRISILPRLAAQTSLRSLVVRMPASIEDVANVVAMLSLEALEISGGDPKSSSIANLARAVPALKTLGLSNGQGWKLDLPQLLRSLPALTTLRLAHMQLTDDQLVTLAATPELAQLVELDIRSNGLTGPGVLAISESPHASGLRRIVIGGNKIDAAAKAALPPHAVQR